MTTGMMVYHTRLRMNLIVCQIDAKGKVICVNTRVFDNNMCQVITADPRELTVGWKTLYD